MIVAELSARRSLVQLTALHRVRDGEPAGLEQRGCEVEQGDGLHEPAAGVEARALEGGWDADGGLVAAALVLAVARLEVAALQRKGNRRCSAGRRKAAPAASKQKHKQQKKKQEQRQEGQATRGRRSES